MRNKQRSEWMKGLVFAEEELSIYRKNNWSDKKALDMMNGSWHDDRSQRFVGEFLNGYRSYIELKITQIEGE